MSIGGARPPLSAGLDLTTKISELFICIMLFRYTDSPNRRSKQPFHHEFISDFHMEYDVGLTSNNSSSDGRVVWSVCLLSCRLGFDSESGQSNDFKIGIHSFPA